MVAMCHMCGSTVDVDGDTADGAKEGFECTDCGEMTCTDCRSIGVGRDSDHCRRCRG